MARPDILCPRCDWRPCGDDRWQCRCGTEWNTFWTGGVCPGCGHAWQETQCFGCLRFSPHRAWYRDRPDEGAPARTQETPVVEEVPA